ncbi:MAG TPA: riboflavin synthase, partial [Candidatus Sulfotelmatobacter sp.]|nr:riboflavin synthase [Candidatus Sulfotelmatobacter sp.]
DNVARPGRNHSYSGGRLELAAERVIAGAQPGSSIAVNGCCLTVVSLDDKCISVEVTPETAGRTTLATVRPGELVNLEAPLRLGAPVNGHLVTGHIDAVGTIREVSADGNSRRVRIAAPDHVLDFVVPKGSIAVEGISLTVVDVLTDAFTIALIPFTLSTTTAKAWEHGRAVNLEVDVLARYVGRSVEMHLKSHPHTTSARSSFSPEAAAW